MQCEISKINSKQDNFLASQEIFIRSAAVPREGICKQNTVVVTITFKQEDAQEMSGTHLDMCRVKDGTKSAEASESESSFRNQNLGTL